jgi:cupin 2 domain-containing protein
MMLAGMVINDNWAQIRRLPARRRVDADAWGDCFRMLTLSGNLFEGAQGDVHRERVSALLEASNLRIERIVSLGHASPPGFWYDQPWAEWVVVLAGTAGVRFEGEADVKVLSEGDYVVIPARVKHRVESTSKDHATIWLAVHYPETE